MKRQPIFASEALLCRSFAAAASEQGWVPYPETSGWDLLLVKGGVQVGIEAKLRPTLHLLAQAVERAGLCDRAISTHGPHHIGLLVPEWDAELAMVAGGFGFEVIWPHVRGGWESRRLEDGHPIGISGRREIVAGEPARVIWPDLASHLEHWPQQHFEEPAWLPPVVPTVAAGVSAPIRLTEWKVRALRLLALLEVRGWVTIADLRRFGMAPSRWYHHWLIPGEVKGRWVRHPGVVLVQDQHPEAFAAAVEEARATPEVATGHGTPAPQGRTPEQLGML